MRHKHVEKLGSKATTFDAKLQFTIDLLGTPYPEGLSSQHATLVTSHEKISQLEEQKNRTGRMFSTGNSQRYAICDVQGLLSSTEPGCEAFKFTNLSARLGGATAE